ncbi:hypothetical protein V6N12_012779 [Hibiscus sabdariffa]|uniref:Uncharacterized protein n=1 Tax=Hibiscus sabdariffa TaxID=183260 RepID=A0ABR2EFD4_9ROSI
MPTSEVTKVQVKTNIVNSLRSDQNGKVKSYRTQDPEMFKGRRKSGNNYVGKALSDLGASINLMPKSIFKKLGIGQEKQTTVMLQLADCSYVQLEGKIEDIVVRLDKFVFPANFLILDCKADEHASVILGRPFLVTGRVFIDCVLGPTAYINAQRKNKIVDPTKDPCTKIRSGRKRCEKLTWFS